MAKIDTFLKLMKEHDASDLHLSAGSPPILRIYGEMQKVSYHNLTEEEIKLLIYEILNEDQIKRFEKEKDLDFAYQAEDIARFRGNVFHHNLGIGASLRIIPNEIVPFSKLGLPDGVRDLARLRSGLVLVTGPTGSGKSTTLAAMIDLLNKERTAHIITLEDPLEFVHRNQKCLITQRQVGVHVTNFAKGLRAALREDPDVVMVGEMRDLETISLAITAAETGLLVFGTLHTNNAAKTVDRIIDAFPKEQQEQIRTMLSESLKGVISQQLLKRADGKGRVVAVEILKVNLAVANLIREGKTFQIASIMQAGKKEGMQLMDQHLLDLVNNGIITKQEAYLHCFNKSLLK